MKKQIKHKADSFKFIVSLTDCLNSVFIKKRKEITDHYGYDLFVKESLDFICNSKHYSSDYHFALYLNVIYEDISNKAPPWDPFIQVAQNQFTLYLAMLVERFKTFRIIETLRLNSPEVTLSVRHAGNETEVDVVVPKAIIQDIDKNHTA